MASALDTVADYITDSRTLLQDVIAPFRYDDDSLLTALNTALLETRRIRPDLFVFKHHDKLPFFLNNDTSPVELEHPFRLAIVYGLCGHALARDQEDVQDNRSSKFMGVFYDMMLGLKSSGVGTGVPG